MKKLLWILLLININQYTIQGQCSKQIDQTGNIQIKVQQNQNNIMPRGVIDIKEVDNSQIEYTQINDNGSFIFENIPIGKYGLFVEWPGFYKVKRQLFIGVFTVKPNTIEVIDIPFPVKTEWDRKEERIKEQEEQANVIIGIDSLDNMYLAKPVINTIQNKVNSKQLAQILANNSIKRDTIIIKYSLVGNEEVFIKTYDKLFSEIGFNKVIYHREGCFSEDIIRD